VFDAFINQAVTVIIQTVANFRSRLDLAFTFTTWGAIGAILSTTLAKANCFGGGRAAITVWIDHGCIAFMETEAVHTEVICAKLGILTFSVVTTPFLDDNVHVAATIGIIDR